MQFIFISGNPAAKQGASDLIEHPKSNDYFFVTNYTNHDEKYHTLYTTLLIYASGFNETLHEKINKI